MKTHVSPSSFEQVYSTYKTRIFHHLYALVGDREQANDLTQDTFLKAFRALDKKSADRDWAAWLYVIATRTAYDSLRRRRLIHWHRWEDLVEPIAGSTSGDPQEHYPEAELVHLTLAHMPARYSTALCMRILNGYSPEQVAHALGYVESGGKMLLWRARTSFREHYRQVLMQERACRLRKDDSDQSLHERILI